MDKTLEIFSIHIYVLIEIWGHISIPGAGFNRIDTAKEILQWNGN